MRCSRHCWLRWKSSSTYPPSRRSWKRPLSFNSEELYTMETVDGMANKIGTLPEPVSMTPTTTRLLKAVTALEPKDIRKVAKKVFEARQDVHGSDDPGDEETGKKSLQKFKRRYAKMFDGLRSRNNTEEAFRTQKDQVVCRKQVREARGQDPDSRTLAECEPILRPNYSTQAMSFVLWNAGGMRLRPRRPKA